MSYVKTHNTVGVHLRMRDRREVPVRIEVGRSEVHARDDCPRVLGSKVAVAARWSRDGLVLIDGGRLPIDGQEHEIARTCRAAELKTSSCDGPVED